MTWAERVTGAWLRWRLDFAIRMRACRFSVPAALSRGLQVGLPLAAILAATVPVWGMSWYFDTENWAAGIWNSWAASRTDTWREAMVARGARIRARLAGRSAKREGRPRRAIVFAVQPEGVSGDFSFIVIGDTGEGDASQHVLRDQLLAVVQPARSAVRRHLVRRRVSDRRDARLRGEVLAAVQGRPQAGVRHSRQPRLVRRARGVQRHVPAARRGARQPESASRGRPAPDEHDRRADRGSRSARRNTCAGSTACRPASSARRSSSCRRIDSRCVAIDTGVLRTIDPAQERMARGGARRAPRAR